MRAPRRVIPDRHEPLVLEVTGDERLCSLAAGGDRVRVVVGAEGAGHEPEVLGQPADRGRGGRLVPELGAALAQPVALGKPGIGGDFRRRRLRRFAPDQVERRHEDEPLGADGVLEGGHHRAGAPLDRPEALEGGVDEQDVPGLHSESGEIAGQPLPRVHGPSLRPSDHEGLRLFPVREAGEVLGGEGGALAGGAVGAAGGVGQDDDVGQLEHRQRRVRGLLGEGVETGAADASPPISAA